MKRSLVLSTVFAALFACANFLGCNAIGGAYPEEGIRRILVTTVTATSATIIWTTTEAESGEVVAWAQDQVVVQGKEGGLVRFHSVTLTGLKPDCLYHYFVRGPSGASYLSRFQTVAKLAGEPDFTMAIVADPQFDGVSSGGGKNFRKVVEEVNSEKIDLVLIPGDLVDNRNGGGHIKDFTPDVNGYAKTFGDFKQIAVGFTMPWYVVPGNHERLHEPGVRELYLRMFEFKKAYYAFDYRGRHFICLDCGSTALLAETGEQFKWLKQDLAANRDKDVYVQLHFAVANDPYVFDGHRGVIPHVQKLLEQHGRVRAVYNGHKNVISATVQNGILYVSCPQPSGVAPGYLIVEVYADGLVQTFHRTPEISSIPSPSAIHPGKPKPGKLRWDSMYRHGRQEARNFSWTFGTPLLSTGVK